MKKLSLLLTFALCLTVGTTFAQGIYLELVKGNGPAPAYATEIPLTSAQYSFSNVITIGSTSGGSGVGRATFTPLVITKQVDGSTGPLQQSLFTGAYYQYARLNFYRQGTSGARELAYRVVLGTVFVSNYSASAAEGCTSGCPALSESITFEYGQVATYNPATQGVVTWNRVTNTATVTPAIPPSAIQN